MILKPNFLPCWLLLTAMSSMCPTRPFLCTNFLSTRMVPTATTWFLASSVIVIVWSFLCYQHMSLLVLCTFPDALRSSYTYIHGYVSSCNWIVLNKSTSQLDVCIEEHPVRRLTCELFLGMTTYFGQDGQNVKKSTLVIVGSKSTKRVSSRQLCLHFRAKQVGFKKRDFRHDGKRERKRQRRTRQTNKPSFVIYTMVETRAAGFRGYRAK